VISSGLTAYFTAAAAAAGTLIGLLFVSISLRTDSIYGDEGTSAGQALAGSAFSALVNAFFVALIALIPDTNIGYPAIILGSSSIIATLRLDRRLPGRKARIARLLFSLATYATEIVVGVTILIHPHVEGDVGNLDYVLIALFAVSLNRAWALLKGEHTKDQPAVAKGPKA
jgi:hypothetical protein